jgi:hypothetical protein
MLGRGKRFVNARIFGLEVLQAENPVVQNHPELRLHHQ